MKQYSCSRSPQFRRALGPAMIIAAITGFSAGANAIEFDTGNRDLSLNWDNTVRYNAGWRMKDPDSRITNSYASDESDLKFKKNDMVTNRVDLYSEIDLVYKMGAEKYGFRVSGTAWYDEAYHNTKLRQNPNLVDSGVFGATLPAPSSYFYNGNKYTSYTERYYKGLSGEILDAFVFANMEFGATPISVKLGQHTVYWGQALFSASGISYSQAGLDARKAVANPGSEIKELFLPVNQISFEAGLMPGLSLAGQYFFDWDPYRIPEGGTYLSSADLVMAGPTNTGIVNPLAGPGFEYLPRSEAIGPDHKSGNWGLNLRWQPDFMGGGSLALTYRKLDEKLPWLFFSSDFKSYRAVYPKKTEIWGLSTDFPVGPVSIAAELAYRKNAALLTPAFAVTPSFAAVQEGARGDVWHFAVNGIYLLPDTPLWDTGTFLAEVSGSYLNKVTKNEDLFQGVGRAACTNPLAGTPGSGNLNDGCGTKTAWGLNVAMTPQWLQVWPGVDLEMPISSGYQIKGNDSDFIGNNEGGYNYSVGMGADIYRKVKVNLAYIGYGGRISRTFNGAYVSNNGTNALLQDRNWLSLTVKTTF